MKILEYDPYLEPYAGDLQMRMTCYEEKRQKLLCGAELKDFASGHLYFGFHREKGGWYYREWAPGAEEAALICDFNGWEPMAMEKLPDGVFQIRLAESPPEGARLKVRLLRGGEYLYRVPAYATYVEQQPDNSWCAVIHNDAYKWRSRCRKPQKPLLIYEAHIGMAPEEGRIGTYGEFTEQMLPRIRDLGYNTVQLMAVMEHPYYASFGYQVTSFFAPSSRYGKPEELKKLIDTAHGMGISVLLDVVHAHACPNVGEGLNLFDGTDFQYFHAGAKGDHPAWGTKCFDYGKNQVLHFLLSNLRYWMEEFRFDGFRFDGVTSMLYHDHGLGVAFTDYGKYFSMNTHTDAVTYLMLANELIHSIRPYAVSIAEDTSAMPGLCLPLEDGGMGFDYRLAMGQPDMWIKLLKEVPDEQWSMDGIYYELTNRRPMEPVIGYCESHDQALVGDKTIMFRLCDAAMYDHMGAQDTSPVIDRGMALHKMLRLVTASLGGSGYLTFMGNEFGHPEWIDFPREGNGWSYHYCRRQWHLAEDGSLKYHYLRDFEKAMVPIVRQVAAENPELRYVHNEKMLLCYQKGKWVFLMNFHPTQSYEGVEVPLPKGKYRVMLSTDDIMLGGHGRTAEMDYTVPKFYLPTRTAVVLKKIK